MEVTAPMSDPPVISAFSAAGPAPLRGDEYGKPLTARQVEVLTAYARTGLTKEVARDLGVKGQTVKSTLGKAYERLGVGTAIEAFTRLGWLRVP